VPENESHDWHEHDVAGCQESGLAGGGAEEHSELLQVHGGAKGEPVKESCLPKKPGFGGGARPARTFPEKIEQLEN